jgi:hypothetical protein
MTVYLSVKCLYIREELIIIEPREVVSKQSSERGGESWMQKLEGQDDST